MHEEGTCPRRNLHPASSVTATDTTFNCRLSLAACKVIFNRHVSSLLLPPSLEQGSKLGETIDVSLWIESIGLKVLQFRHFSSSLWGTSLVSRRHGKIQRWWWVATGPRMRMMSTCGMRVIVHQNRRFVFTSGSMCTKTCGYSNVVWRISTVWWLVAKTSPTCTCSKATDLIDVKTTWLAFFSWIFDSLVLVDSI